MTEEMEKAFIKIREYLIKHRDNPECAEMLKHSTSRIELIAYMTYTAYERGAFNGININDMLKGKGAQK